jgi:uncharacterized protein YebE (UPF0316 family)
MEIGLDSFTLLLGMVIFAARVLDVSIGTIRTISIIHGRTVLSFFLAVLEIGMWLTVIATVLDQIAAKPILGVFYAFGFATGNVVGIELEKRLAFGYLELRIIAINKGQLMAEEVRNAGYPVTVLHAEGQEGPVLLLYIVCKRRYMSDILGIIKRIEPAAFYIANQVGKVSKIYRPFMPRPTGWRAIAKKK